MPVDVPREQFDLMVQRAIANLPAPFREALDVVRLEVLDHPSHQQLRGVGLEDDELLLGLYEGVPLPERSVDDSPRLPDVIYLFYEDLQDACDSEEELEREIGITFFHELGHYFGFDEEELEEFGYG